ncbi:AAA family ATPase [Lachnospira multipara]|uniref:AAA family ATPase n=1 Tax=Lachnospira multipara TaxID=28051 RepID=UPI0004867F37|nr:AAA family ATPase [Lachnospira multipara]
MRINKLVIENFKGYEGIKELDLPQIICLLGANGAGKTSIIDAINYGLTGNEPAGEIINTNASYAKVYLEIENTTSKEVLHFSREVKNTTPRKTTIKIEGKTNTAKVLTQMIENISGIPMDKLKITTSSEVISNLSPQEFSSLILSYIPEKLKRNDVISLVPALTPGMKDTIESFLPESDINLDTIESFYKKVFEDRAMIRKKVDALKLIIDELPSSAPFDSNELLLKRDELKKAILLGEEYEKNINAYQKSLIQAQKYNEQVSALEREIESIKAVRPNGADKDLKNKINELNNLINNNSVIISTQMNSISEFKNTLDLLSKPVCPISPLIVCHEDKTSAKNEIEESIKALENSIQLIEKNTLKLRSDLENATKTLDEYNANAIEYQRKLDKMSILKQLKNNQPVILEKPAELTYKKEELKIKIEDIESKLKMIKDCEQRSTKEKQLKIYSEMYNDYNNLVKVFDKKGEVRNAIVSKYLGFFEDICNKRSCKYRPNNKFIFETNKGVVVKMSNDKGLYLPYQSLSNGEKAYFLFIIMDMINQLVGTKIMVLDELSVMDKEALMSLAKTINDFKNDYDNVILAAVDYSEIKDTILSTGIPNLYFGK